MSEYCSGYQCVPGFPTQVARVFESESLLGLQLEVKVSRMLTSLCYGQMSRCMDSRDCMHPTFADRTASAAGM
eukprot:2497377-Amphidinium_carterae.1